MSGPCFSHACMQSQYTVLLMVSASQKFMTKESIQHICLSSRIHTMHFGELCWLKVKDGIQITIVIVTIENSHTTYSKSPIMLQS